MKIATEQGARHFAATFIDWFHSVAQEAELRDTRQAPTVSQYLSVRLDNVGARSLYAMGELCMSIPDDIFTSSLHNQLVYLGSEMITIDNVSVSTLMSSSGTVLDISCVGYSVVQQRASSRDCGLQYRHGRDARAQVLCERSGPVARYAQPRLRGQVYGLSCAAPRERG